MQDLALKIADLFSLPPRKDGHPVVELRALTHGVPPKAIAKNLELFAQEWAVSGVDAWNELHVSSDVFLVGDETDEERAKKFGWWTLPEVVGDRFISRLLNATPGTCIMLSNGAQMVFQILSCLELQQPKKRKIICSDGEFPSVLHTIQNYNRLFSNYSIGTKKEVSFDLQVIKLHGREFRAESFIEEIDDRTALVIFSHVGFVRGERVPDQEIQEISSACRKHGALFALDGYHAIGAHRIDVKSLDVDIYFGGLLKEGCGSTSNCFLYSRPGLELTPSYSGWFADQEPFAFNPNPIPHDSIRRRFLLGTPAIAPLYHGLEGLKIMLNIGLDSVAADVLAKVTEFAKALNVANIKIASPLEPERMSSLMVINAPEANRLRDYLINEKGVLVDARKNSFIRLAPHIYNSWSDLGYSAQSVVKALTSKDYLSYTIPQKSGPVT